MHYRADNESQFGLHAARVVSYGTGPIRQLLKLFGRLVECAVKVPWRRAGMLLAIYLATCIVVWDVSTEDSGTCTCTYMALGLLLIFLQWVPTVGTEYLDRQVGRAVGR